MRRLGEPKEAPVLDAVTIGLYDVNTIAQIEPVIQDALISKDSPEWKLKPKSNDRFLVLASCTDLAVFNLSETVEYDFNTSLGGNITDYEILGDSSFCVVIIDKRQVVILSLDKRTIYFNEPAPHPIDFVVCNPTPSVCYLTFGSRSGDWNTVMMQGEVAASNANNRVECLSTEEIQDYFLQAMQKTISRQVDMMNVHKDVMMVPSGPLQSFASIVEEKGILYCGLASTSFSLVGSEKQWIRVRDGGRFILTLDTDGWIHIFDPTIEMFWNEFDVKTSKNQQVLDFVVIDKSDVEVPTLFALVVKDESSTGIVIYDRTKKEITFSLPSVSTVSLFAYSGGERVMMSVEEVQAESDDDLKNSRVVIRQISQSRPEMRFEALLKSNKFAEAEVFAKTFNLDVQKVYKSHVYYLTDMCDEDDEAFSTIMRTMDKITDHNMVAETYFTLVGMSRRCDRIRTYLTQAKKRKIGDMETLRLLEAVTYTWATFRIVSGPESDSLEENIWEMFVNALHGEDPWVEMYNEFICQFQFAQARVIFARHQKSITDYLCLDDTKQVERIEGLFQMFADAISSDVCMWRSIVEHITTDIFPSCIMDLDKLVPHLESLIMMLIPLLESRDSANWPDNAIKAASSYDTMIKVLVSTANTPASQSVFVLQCSSLARTVDGEPSSISRVKKLFYDLHELKRLKEVYQCSISFSAFQGLTSEGICHKILLNAFDNPNSTQTRIEKFVKPFMAERGLDQEETIYNYIQKVSSAALSNRDIFGWEKQCVQLCDSLGDEARRCSSVVSIASASKVPWPAELNEAVGKILASRSLPRSDIEALQMVCKRTELFVMLSSYGFGRDDIKILTHNDANMDIIVAIRCMLAQREKPSRFVDSMKLLELLIAMNESQKCGLQTEYIQSLVVVHMMSHDDVTSSIINYINSLGDREKARTISLVFSFIERIADTPATGQNIEERSKMLGIGEELLSYYVCRDNDYNDPQKKLKDDLVLLREIQKDYKMAVVLSDFKNAIWQMEFMKNLLEKKDPLRVKINKCNYMGIPVEDLINMVVTKAINENDIEQLVSAISTYIECINPWTECTLEMFEPIPHLLSFVTFRLPELSCEESDATRADHIAIVIKSLGRVVRETIRKFPFEVISDNIDFLLQLEAFFTLGDQIIIQSLRGHDNVRSETSGSNETVHSDASNNRIFGFKPSLGTYDFSGDPALFEGISGVLYLARVAPSVARPYESEITADDADCFRSNWEQLNAFLAMHSQDLLDISARVFAGSLRCFSGEYRQSIIELEQPILSVIERMLQQKKFDLWHAVTLLSGIPIDRIENIVMELSRRSGVKSSTKSFIQYTQLAFVMCLAANIPSRLPVIVNMYEQKFLMKKLAEDGIRANISSLDFVDKVVQQAVELKQSLPPYRLYDYVKKYKRFSQGSKSEIKTTVGEYMTRYATLLIRKASAAGKLTDSEDRREEILKHVEMARTALRIAGEEGTTCIVHYLRCLVYVLCPYNYEVVQFVVTSLEEFATEADDLDFCKSLKAIMSFMWTYERTNHISNEESIWFTKRESKLLKGEKEYEKSSRKQDPFGFDLRMIYEDEIDSNSDTTYSDSVAQDNLIYEKNTVVISDMPALASRRLPFHPFLLRKKEDTDETVMAIVKAELSIFNVPVWQAYVREVSWLAPRFSRSQLLSCAIFAHANKYAIHGKSLPPGERETIFLLLNSASHRRTVISTIALLFKKIVLSDVKIELLQMGVDISQKWSAENIGEEERADLVDHCERLQDGIAKFTTELALKKNGLYTEKTADRIEMPEELCSHIYDEMTDWANSSDVAKKCLVVQKIADANGVDLSKLHERLVLAWVEDTETSEIPINHVDMNESIGGTSFTIDQKEDSNDKDEIRMPLFDTVLDKIIILCKRVEKSTLLKRLTTVLFKGGRKAKGGYTAVVRATCIILRYFADEDIQQIQANATLCDICGTLEVQLRERLFDMADVKWDQKNVNPQLVKTLLQCPSRSQPMTALIASLIIDHEFPDIKGIEQIMTRLQISKQWNILRALLDYVRTNHLDSMIRSFPLLWFRVYENALLELNSGPMANSDWKYEQCVMLRKWTLWAMSSNVEGGRQSNVSRFLREINCPVAASIVSVLSSWTIESMDEVDSSRMDVERDMCLHWTTAATTANNSRA